MSECQKYGYCRYDPDTGEILCHRFGGWRPACPIGCGDDELCDPENSPFDAERINDDTDDEEAER